MYRTYVPCYLDFISRILRIDLFRENVCQNLKDANQVKNKILWEKLLYFILTSKPQLGKKELNDIKF